MTTLTVPPPDVAADGFPRRWRLPFAVLLIAGLALRFLYPQDIEYKWDEAQIFGWSQRYTLADYPAVAQVTSSGLRAPGLNVGYFVLLARIFNAHDPPALARAIALMNVLGVLGFLFLALKVVPARRREPWLWATLVLAVHPLAILYSRKIWQPSITLLPLAILLTLWWCRRRPWGAFCYAFWAVIVAQLHMAGFFLFAALVLWDLLLYREKIHWPAAAAGTLLGAATMARWIFYAFTTVAGRFAPGLLPPPAATTAPATLPSHNLDASFHSLRFKHLFEFKFYLRWFTQPFGSGVNFSLGKNNWRRFLAGPELAGFHTHLLGLLQLAILAIAVTLLVRWVRAARVLQPDFPWKATLTGRSSPTASLQMMAFVAYGGLLTLSSIEIYRHYLVLIFPFLFLWLARLALLAQPQQTGRRLLWALCVAHLIVSFSFMQFLHTTHGDPNGRTASDYAVPYQFQSEHPTPCPHIDRPCPDRPWQPLSD